MLSQACTAGETGRFFSKPSLSATEYLVFRVALLQIKLGQACLYNIEEEARFPYVVAPCLPKGAIGWYGMQWLGKNHAAYKHRE